MSADNKSTSIHGKTIGACIVMLAVLSMLGLLVLLFKAPWMFNPQHAQGLLAPMLIGSMIVSVVGGFLMVAVTKRIWWLLPPLLVALYIIGLLIFARTAGIAGMH